MPEPDLGLLPVPVPELLLDMPSEAELRRRGGKKWSSHPDDVLPLWLADMDFGVAEPVRDAVLRFAEHGAFEYPPESSYAAVAEAFVSRMRDRFAWDAGSEGTEVVADLVQGLTTCALAYTDPGDTVLTLTPVYPPLLRAGGLAGRRMAGVPLGDLATGYAVDVDTLARAAADPRARLLLLCNPHNPTGRVLSADELSAVAEIAERSDLVVISDEIHADLVLDGSRHLPFAAQSAAAATRTVTLQSATKAFNIGGLRCGVLHFGSDALRQRFEKSFPSRTLGRVSGVSAAATVAAWMHGDAWLDAVVATLRRHHRTLDDWVLGHDGAVEGSPPQATYLAWLRFLDLADADDSAGQVLLDRARVALSPGEEFGGPAYRDHARINFAASEQTFDAALRRIDGVLRPQGFPPERKEQT